jgi:hypothetical protein
MMVSFRVKEEFNDINYNIIVSLAIGSKVTARAGSMLRTYTKCARMISGKHRLSTTVIWGSL